MRLLQGLFITVMAVGVFLFVADQVRSQQWYPIKEGRLFGISGMALFDHCSNRTSFLVVHDNKKQNECRLALLTVEDKNQLRYFPLNWPQGIEPPIDLEAVTSIPGNLKSSFMALTSSGKIYHIQIDIPRTNVSVIKIFDLPNISKGSNFEGFSMQTMNDRILTVWSHRGENAQPAKIYWGLFDLTDYKFSQTTSTNLKVTWPENNVRHISDLKVDAAGILFISSASDPGDDGPFQSAAYVVGVFCIHNNEVVFRQNLEPVKIYKFESHKVEALEFLPGKSGGMVFVTDDENMGSSIFLNL